MFKLIVEQDEHAFDPREEGYMDHFGTMVCFHGRYNLGDKDHGFDTPQDFEYFCNKDVVRLPLYLYDHSGITMNTTGFTCPWDSGQVGYIYVTKEKIREEFNAKRITKKLIEKAKNILLAEVTEYDNYLVGNVFGYRIIEVDKDGDEVNEVEACWGFIGDEEYCRKEGEEALKNIA